MHTISKRFWSFLFHSTALHIAFTYLIISIIWITTSDQLSALFAPSTATLTRWQTYKGTSFVVISACLIFIMIHRAITQRDRIQKDLHQRNSELALLNEASNVHNLPLTNALDQLLKTMCSSLAIQACGIFLNDKVIHGLLSPTYIHANMPAVYEWLQQHGESISQQSISLGETDVRIITPDKTDYIAAAVLLYTKENIYGTILIVTTKERYASKSEPQLLLSLASAVAITIENTHLYNRLARYAVNLEQRVEERTQSLAQANEKLRALDALKSKFITEITRELRTPITSLVVYTDLLKRGNPERQTHYLHSLDQQVARLVRLFEDSLDLSRLEMLRTEQEQPMHPFQINQVVSDVVAAFHPRTQEGNIALHAHLADDLPEIIGEQNQIAQAVGHLLINAFTYTAVGEINVRTYYQPAQNRICLEVVDTGPGISADDLPYVCDSFYRGHDAKTLDVPGNGLGLAIVKEITELHKGQIEIESEPNQGTTVRICLPVESKT